MLKRVRFFHFLSFIYPKKDKNNSFQLHNPQPESHQLTSFQKKVPSPQAETPKQHRGNNRTFSSTKSHRPSLATHNARSRLASCARIDGLQLKPLQQAEDENPSCLGKQGSLYHWLVVIPLVGWVNPS